jgi:RNA polymerase sigma factor (sigma-70 family)
MFDNKAIDAEKIWQTFLKDDATALGKIFNYYYEDLYNYGIKFGQQAELVKDCIQDVFVEIGQRRTSLSNVKSVKAYLIVCFRRILLHHLEKQRDLQVGLNEQKQQDFFTFSPEDIIIQKEISQEQQQALKHALQSLPARQKEVLFLRYFNGMSYDEIEQILSINYQSVRNYIYRATKRLRNILEHNNHF